MRLVEIPDDGIVRIPINKGKAVIGEYRINLSFLPTADARRIIRARWQDSTPMWIANGQKLSTCRLVCTRCGRRTSHRKAKSYKYCPNCGAQMDGMVDET